MRRVALSCVALSLLAGCGEAAMEPLPDVRPVAPTAAQRAALTHVVADFDRHYRRGDGKRVCALITPLSQGFIVDFMASARPAQAPASCAEAVIGDERPPAAAEAAARRFRSVTVTPDGGSATITFSDCRRWRLVRQGGAWLINDFPIIPRSLRDVRRDCAATDRPTA
jgi:hypothetical protein